MTGRRPLTHPSAIVNRIDRFLSILPKRNGSDLHLAVGSPPMLRIDGELERIRYPGADGRRLSTTWSDRSRLHALGGVLGREGDVDFAYQMGARRPLPRQPLPAGARLRGRFPAHPVPRADGRRAAAAASRSRSCRTAQSGLVLVTGPTGSGKSTTLAAILDRVNQRLSYHVVTIEDPIEFVHTNARSVFTQREIGTDVPAFAEGVKAAIREDPDCLLVGEMRDLDTIRMALTAAETGLLVFATLHTNSAAKAVDRIIDAFPADEQEQIRIVLAENLRAVVAQQLLNA